VDASLPKIRRLRATPVNVPLARPHPTASGVVSLCAARPHGFRNGPGADGSRLRVLLYPIVLKPIAELIEALQPLIQGDAVAPLVLAQKLKDVSDCLAARVHRDSHGGYRHGGLGRFWRRWPGCLSPDFSAAKKKPVPALP